MSSPAPAHPRISDEEYTTFVDGARDKWMSFVISKRVDRCDAEDVVSSAIARGYRYLGSFRGDSSLATWMRHIVFNELRQHWRRCKLHGVVDNVDNYDGLSGISIQENPLRAVQLAEVMQAVKTLPPHYRCAVYEYLREDGKFSMAVRLRRMRAVKMIQKKLGITLTSR